MSIFKKVLSVGSGKLTSELNKIVEEINSRESSLEKLTDEEIKSGFRALSDKIDDTPHSIEVEAFAFVREAAKRKLSCGITQINPFKKQIITYMNSENYKSIPKF